MLTRSRLESAPVVDLEFPLRVAAIDIGSNAIRFTASEFLDRSRRIDLQSQRVPVRLGRSAYLSGQLAPDAIDAAVQALGSFRRHLDGLGITAYRAVATSAVRETDNGEAFIERARAEAGIEVEAITGSEEARLVWLAVRDRLTLDADECWMLVDLGGGSLEVSIVNVEGIEWTESHTIGTVRMLDALGAGGDRSDPRAMGRLMEEYAGTLRLDAPRRKRTSGVIATGGNIEALAQLAGARPDDLGVSRLPLAALRATTANLVRTGLRERVDTLGLREDRADVIVPAAYLYARVAELAGASEIVVPHVGVKDGVLLDLVEGLTTHALHASRQERSVWGAAVALGRRYRFDEAHGVHVARLALSLFDQLGSLHRLGGADRRILLGASLLHDIGQFVSYRRHHKHSFYLIRNAELSVFSPFEIPLVALVARYHRGADPQGEHEVWRDLVQRDRGRVVTLAALLRIADALDREHLQRVSAVRALPGPDTIRLEVEARGDLLLELWALDRKGDLFERAFGGRPHLVRMETME